MEHDSIYTYSGGIGPPIRNVGEPLHAVKDKILAVINLVALNKYIIIGAYYEMRCCLAPNKAEDG